MTFLKYGIKFRIFLLLLIDVKKLKIGHQKLRDNEKTHKVEAREVKRGRFRHENRQIFMN